MHIKELRVFGFKRFREASISFSEGINIVVGDNDSGKSTLLEAVTAVIDGQYRGAPLMRSISEDLFNKDIVDEYLCLLKNGKPCNPPSIVIEVVFSGEEDTVALYKGDFNSRGVAESGIKLDIAIDAESFSDEYQDFVAAKSHHGLPIEYYACSWTTFARKSIRPAGIKFKSALVGAGNSLAWPGSKAMVTRIARDVLERSDQIAISQVHRRMRTGFSADQTVKSINEKISERAKSLTNKAVTFGFEAGTVNSWENGVITKLEDIPFSNVGDGTKSIVSTELALAKSEKRGGNVVLLEEPENHLSHTRLNMFLEGVKSRCEGVQLIITTHSSFVANKLELRNLILLNGGNSASMRDLSEDTSRFFMKAPGYKTLRVLLCDTGLYTRRYETIYGLFEPNTRPDARQRWFLKGFFKERDPMLVSFEYLPCRVRFTEDPSELVFDYRLPIRSNIDHILGDEENLTRIPASLMGEGNSLLLRRAFEGAVVEAARRAAANYTLAVPQFYGGRIQLLLPLCLTGDKPELALTIQREDGFYAARTCLTLEMAYNNARLICRPETSWIKR